jgi:phenylalanyl-tRNA synthetase alpha chain
MSNVPAGVAALVGRNLHKQPLHPLNIVSRRIQNHFRDFKVFDDLAPQVSVAQCFDQLNVPQDHISRKPSDTFYLDALHVLRTHTSAHQNQLLMQGHERFLVFGDCYRRDQIDATHYPVFHQVEGVKTWRKGQVTDETVIEDLKQNLEGLTKSLFQNRELEIRWVDAYFPFTHPSLEMEVRFRDDWLELLGCGVIQKNILANCGREGENGWAFGIGLERIAMTLFSIPDIRLFWSQDPRFINQFASGEVIQFQPYSKFPPCPKDISFWIPELYNSNDFYALVRDIAGDLVENVELVDEFTHPKTNRQSHCYRIIYRSMDRSLLNSEVNDLQEKVRQDVVGTLGVELR